MADASSSYLNNIPLPTETGFYHPKPFLPNFLKLSALSTFIKKIQFDDILLVGLIILLLTEDSCDNFLLILIVLIFIGGFDF